MASAVQFTAMNGAAFGEKVTVARLGSFPVMLPGKVGGRGNSSSLLPPRTGRGSSISGEGEAKAWAGSLRVTARINIDRRRHLEEAFKRQLEAEKRRALMAVSCPVECVREVRNLTELEAELAAAERESQLVVVDFFNSSCGSCKNMLPHLVTLCKTGALDSCFVGLHEIDASPSPSSSSLLPGAIAARFLKHNVRDEYDDLTDIARMYRIKIVPTFAFFLDGCRIGQLVTRDSGRVAANLARLMEEKQKAWRQPPSS